LEIRADLSFEKAMEELESIVKKMEEGKLSLDEAMSFYERGNALKVYCEQKLQSAKAKIEKISISANGNIEKEEFSL